MSTARRSYLSMPPALESMRLYREKLREYSSDELEDIYFHINLLREPLRYRLVQMEMEQRGLQPGREVETLTPPAAWLDRIPGLAGVPAIRSIYLTVLLFLSTAVLMALMLTPIWLFARPLHFTGIQASLVYLVLLPVTSAVGLAFGLRSGGFRLRSVSAVLAVAISLWAFWAAGGWDSIVQPLYRAGALPGSAFGGW